MGQLSILEEAHELLYLVHTSKAVRQSMNSQLKADFAAAITLKAPYTVVQHESEIYYVDG